MSWDSRISGIVGDTTTDQWESADTTRSAAFFHKIHTQSNSRSKIYFKLDQNKEMRKSTEHPGKLRVSQKSSNTRNFFPSRSVNPASL